MRRWSRNILGCALAGLIPAAANAQSSKSFDVCGGSFPGLSVLGFCAAADVAVSLINNQPTVTMKVWNLSGSDATWDKSNPWTTIVAVGLMNVIPTSVNYVGGSLRVSGPCFANSNGCDYSQYWRMGNDVQVAGWNIDLLGLDSRGGGIISSCDPNNPLLTRDPYLYTSCNRDLSGAVTMTFNVTQNFDLANGGDLFLKGQYQGNMTYCTTAQAASCSPIVATPEPGTLALFGSGLAGFGGFGFFRRKRKPDDDT